MVIPQSPGLLQATRPDAVGPGLRRQLIDCWVAVANAGGAVIAAGFPMPPVSEREVAPVADRLIAGLEPDRSRILMAAYGDALAGWLVLRRDPHPLIAHCGVVNHVQTHPAFRGRGIGAALMERVRVVAREEMGLERLQLSARSGLGLEEFYRRLGWVEVGRWPGALRVAPGDDRDDILMGISL
ncbi:GNAT family N-acetyltransferase [Streptomyces sp. NBC_00091]|uniref:GNAT family N-acetyltransferase n=1 Tax=Streptomyces sp. NBC_00091 TaxID=2975648 RepID=UPI002259811C|nr:GNAT family N-acetyltransferase [Streptomyces sp. NBC_00091]MCX5381609.1 GNAT family N-acetyltransferase [Streptomyces sp. NBC_00091]